MNYFETVQRWVQLKDTIQHLQAEERALREGLFSGTFPSPREGVNSYDLPDGTVLKGTYVINRKLKEDAYKENWSKIVQAAKIPSAVATKLIRTKYELSVTPYKKLDEEQRKAVDGILEIKPGLPKLELVPPKE